MPRSADASMPPATPVPTARRREHRRALGGDERDQAGDEGEARHQDGAEAGAGAVDRGVDDSHAGLAPRLGELDDQDRVLRRERDQHDEADLGVDVERQAREHQRQRARRRRRRTTESSTGTGIVQLS